MNFKRQGNTFLSLLLAGVAVCPAVNLLAAPMRHVNESSLHISRYVESTPGPTEAQFDPLHVVIPRVKFTHGVKSVGQAVNLLLVGTGYRLASHHPDKRVMHMLKLGLPTIHRNMGPLTLEQTLKTLVSKPWMLSVDPIHRLVSYELPDLYQQPRVAHLKKRIYQSKSNSTKKKVVAKHRKVKKNARKNKKKTSKEKSKTAFEWDALFSGDD